MTQVNLDALQYQSSTVDATDDNQQVETTDTTSVIIISTTADATEIKSDSSSLPAIAEDLPNGCNSQDTKVSNELDAEMVSEDELPAPAQPKIDDAEDLSDEDLPAPKRAELPADTEIVSEDELPSSNKTKRKIEDGHEADSTNDNAETPKKRAKSETDSTYMEIERHKRFVFLFIFERFSNRNFHSFTPDKEAEKPSEPIEKVSQRKTLPDLDRYWKAVNDDPSDFTAWTYLLQYVEQEVLLCHNIIIIKH